MNPEQQSFFMMSVEIRILASVMVRIAHRSMEERFSTHKADISGLQYGILRTLKHETFTLSDLSRRFMLDPSTLVPVIQTLERKGLVSRSRDPNDRRRWSLFLTKAGDDLIQDVPLMSEDDILFRCLSAIGQDKAHELLNLLREVVQQMPDGAELLEAVSSRMYTVGSGENVAKPHDCVIQRKEPAESNQPEEQHPMIRRVIRPRTRRTRRG